MAKPVYVYTGTEFIQIASATTNLDPYVLRAPEVKMVTSDYTLAVGDEGKILKSTLTTPVTVTIPLNTTAELPVGTTIRLLQSNTGQMLVAAEAGVTLTSYSAGTNLAGQWAEATLTHHYLNEWVINGTLSA